MCTHLGLTLPRMSDSNYVDCQGYFRFNFDDVKVKTFGGHQDDVNCVAFTSDFASMATGCDDAVVRVFNAETGRTLLKLKGHKDAVRAVAFSPVYGILASASLDHTVRLWLTDVKAKDPTLRVLRGHQKSVETLAFSADDAWLCSSGWDRIVIVWGTRDWCPLLVLDGHEDVVMTSTFSMHRDVRFLATAGWDCTVCVWKMPQIKELCAPDMSVDVGGSDLGIDKTQRNERNGALAVTADENAMTVEPEEQSGDVDAHHLYANNVDSVHASNVDADNADSMPLVSAHGDTVIQGDAKMNERGGLLATNTTDETSEEESSTLGCSNKRCSNTSMYPVRGKRGVKFKLLHVLRGHLGNVRTVAFSNYGMLGSGSWDKTIRLWHPKTGKCIFVLEGHTGWVQTISFSKDNLYLASAADDDSLRIWSCATGACLRALEQPHTETVATCAFTPNGVVVVCGPHLYTKGNERNEAKHKTKARSTKTAKSTR